MRKSSFFWLLTAVVLWSCTTRQFDKCPPDRIFGEWAVLNDSHDFGPDSTGYYIINPIKTPTDTTYFNGNYTDTYFKADSTKISLQYLLSDTVRIAIDRLYSVLTDPDVLYLNINVVGDTTLKDIKKYKIYKKKETDKVYTLVPDSGFRNLLLSGDSLNVFATNFPNSYEVNPNAQNYTFILQTKGFKEALELCYKLNGLPDPFEKDSVKTKRKKAY